MIRLIFGNVGSGKTASVVRMMKNSPHKNFITNIKVKGRNMKHIKPLKAEMIIKKVYVKTLKNGEDVYKLTLNIEFWKKLIKEKKNLNIVLDEAHVLLNPRRSMSKINIIMTDFLALLRRVLGTSEGTGELLLISQLDRRLDIIAKEMATHVSYCVCHYVKHCNKCGLSWSETNETSEKFEDCPRCNNFNIKRNSHKIEMFEFTNLDKFTQFNDFGNKTYFKRYYITDIEQIFGNYDTFQFDDLLSEY